MKLSWRRTGAAAFCLVFVLHCFMFASEPACPASCFQARCAALAVKADQSGAMAVTGKNGWLFLASELRHTGAGLFWGGDAARASRAAAPEHADPLPAILDFHQQLKARGIELLMVPVPAKAVIYSEYLPGAPNAQSVSGSSPRLDVHESTFYGILEEHGISVLDLAPLFLDAREHEKGPVYCMQDSHWSGVGCVLAASRIAGYVRGMDWYSRPAESAPESEWMRVSISGDLWRALDDDKLTREELNLRRIGGTQPREPDGESPVVLLGDSHNLVFHSGGDMHSRWAGLADQLALELGFAVDLVAVRGSGATPARINLFRRAQRNPDYWDGKKIVIWCFSVREFTQSDGWRKVPIAP